MSGVLFKCGGYDVVLNGGKGFLSKKNEPEIKFSYDKKTGEVFSSFVPLSVIAQIRCRVANKIKRGQRAFYQIRNKNS